MQDKDEVLAAALRYAAAGLRIYPVLIPGLKPDGKKDVRVPVRWKEAATDSADQVRAWWNGTYAGYGIGVDCGASGLAVGDLDVKSGVDGFARWDALDMPATARSRTPSEGEHRWYRNDGSVGSGSNSFGTKEDPCGIDVRGVGGTIFLPPTEVPGYGRYEWVDGEPDWAALPAAPAALARACPPGGKGPSAASGGSSVPTLSAPTYVADAAPGLGGGQLFGVVKRTGDRPLTIEDARKQLEPLWVGVRDTKPPNGLYLAVYSFARHAAHFRQFWDQAWVEGMVLRAYAEGGHGFSELDAGDLRAIGRAYSDHAVSRAAEDDDAGWEASPVVVPSVIPEQEISKADWLMSQLVTAEELAALPAPVPLVYDVLDMNTETWLIGDPGSFKSFVALDIAGHVGAGRMWQGHRVRQGEVIYMAAEGAGGMTLRTRAWQKHYGAMDGVKFLPLPLQVKNAAEWAALVEVCRRVQPSLVIIDTQHRVTRGLEENSSTDFNYYLEAIGAVRAATGACVLTVHHTGRSGGNARGTSAIDGAQDSELKLSRMQPRGSLKVKLKDDKQKDMAENEEGTELQLKSVDLGIDPATDRALSSLVVLPEDAWKAAGALLVEPEPWEAGHADVIVQLFKVLREQGETGGLTKAEARHAVVERFYAGNTKALNRSTWYTGWDRAQAKESASGDRVMVNVRGEKWTVDPVALSGMEPRDP